MAKWKRLEQNEVLDFNDWHISFNPAPWGGKKGGFGSDDGGPETALVQAGIYLILNGDFRREYEVAAEKDGFGGCLRVYNENIDKRSSWSEDSKLENNK